MALCGPPLFVKLDPFTERLGRAQARRTVGYLVDRIGGKSTPIHRRRQDKDTRR